MIEPNKHNEILEARAYLRDHANDPPLQGSIDYRVQDAVHDIFTPFRHLKRILQSTNNDIFLELAKRISIEPKDSPFMQGVLKHIPSWNLTMDHGTYQWQEDLLSYLIQVIESPDRLMMVLDAADQRGELDDRAARALIMRLDEGFFPPKQAQFLYKLLEQKYFDPSELRLENARTRLEGISRANADQEIDSLLKDLDNLHLKERFPISPQLFLLEEELKSGKKLISSRFHKMSPEDKAALARDVQTFRNYGSAGPLLLLCKYTEVRGLEGVRKALTSKTFEQLSNDAIDALSELGGVHENRNRSQTRKRPAEDSGHAAKAVIKFLDFYTTELGKVNEEFKTSLPNDKDYLRCILTAEDNSTYSLYYPKKGAKELAFMQKNNEQPIPVLPDYLSSRLNTVTLQKAFAEDRIELIFGKESDYVLGDQFWEGWESGIDGAETYRDKVHPMMCDRAVRILNEGNTPTPLVVDVCGGTGTLARKIIDTFGSRGNLRRKMDFDPNGWISFDALANPKEAKYTVLEYNNQSVIEARKTLGRDAQVVKTDVIHEEEFYLDSDKKQKIQPNSVDLFVCCGALTHRVMPDSQSAFEVMKKIVGYLKPGGYCLLAGATPQLLNSADFRNLGLEVKSMISKDYLIPFYVVRKKDFL
jgi:hypothetical protein